MKWVKLLLVTLFSSVLRYGHCLFPEMEGTPILIKPPWTVSYSFQRFENNGIKSTLFAPPQKDAYLNASILERVTTSSSPIEECLFRCTTKSDCMSVNYKDGFCELIGTIKEKYPKQLQARMGYNYRGIIHEVSFENASGIVFSQCNLQSSLLSLLPTSSFSVSSNFPGYEGYKATLDKKGWGSHGTGPGGAAKLEWIQIDFPGLKTVTQIRTKGIGVLEGDGSTSKFWVSSYYLLFTTDGSTWFVYAEDQGTQKVFTGNSDYQTIATQTLPYPVRASKIRVVVKTYEHNVASYDYVGFRLDVEGC